MFHQNKRSNSNLTLIPEAVIYSLINNFVISPAYPDEEIKWQVTTALFPVIRGQEDRGAQLPLKLRAI